MPKVEEKPAIVPVVSPSDTRTLLKDIDRRLESLVAKAKTREALQKRLSSMHMELADMRYLIKVLQAQT